MIPLIILLLISEVINIYIIMFINYIRMKHISTCVAGQSSCKGCILSPSYSQHDRP